MPHLVPIAHDLKYRNHQPSATLRHSLKLARITNTKLRMVQQNLPPLKSSDTTLFQYVDNYR